VDGVPDLQAVIGDRMVGHDVVDATLSEGPTGVQADHDLVRRG
jgi:hypothetical protein